MVGKAAGVNRPGGVLLTKLRNRSPFPRATSKLFATGMRNKRQWLAKRRNLTEARKMSPYARQLLGTISMLATLGVIVVWLSEALR